MKWCGEGLCSVGRVCVAWGGCVQCGSVVMRYVGRMVMKREACRV